MTRDLNGFGIAAFPALTSPGLVLVEVVMLEVGPAKDLAIHSRA